MKLLIIISLFPFLTVFPQTGKVFPLQSGPEKIFAGGFFTEGPACGSNGCIYFSDQTFTDETDVEARIIWKYDPAKDTTVVFRSPSGMSNGIAFDREGRMVVCEGANFGGRMITRTDMRTGKSRITAGLYMAVYKYNITDNDSIKFDKILIKFDDEAGPDGIKTDYTGNLFIAVQDENKPQVTVYTPGGELINYINIPEVPSNLTFTPDGKELYITAGNGLYKAGIK